MRVLLTGHMGFIGSHTLEWLVASGHKVVCMDNGITGRPANLNEIERGSYEAIPRGDITDGVMEEGGRSWVSQVVEEYKPEAIIHLAAQPSLLASYNDPVYDLFVNGMGTLALVRAAIEHKVKKFVFSSTSAVYRPSQRMPLNESGSHTGPNRPYGISKYAAECYIRSLLPENHAILRYGNVYGPRQIPLGPNQLIPRALSYIFNGKEFEVYGDGTAIRDYVFVTDVARANVTAIENDKALGRTFNISSGKGHEVNYVMKLLKAASNYKGLFKHGEAVRGEPTEVRMDNSWARLFLDWGPRIGIEVGVERTVEWWKEHMAP